MQVNRSKSDGKLVAFGSQAGMRCDKDDRKMLRNLNWPQKYNTASEAGLQCAACPLQAEQKAGDGQRTQPRHINESRDEIADIRQYRNNNRVQTAYLRSKQKLEAVRHRVSRVFRRQTWRTCMSANRDPSTPKICLLQYPARVIES